MSNTVYFNGTIVMSLDVAINSPEIIDVQKMPSIAKTLIIPTSVYSQRLSQWEDEDTDRGASAIELSSYLDYITYHSAIEKVSDDGITFRYTYPDSGDTLLLVPSKREAGNSSSQTTIKLAKDYDADIITSKASMITDARTQGINAHLLKPDIYSGYRNVFLPESLHGIWTTTKHCFTAAEWCKYFDEEPLRPNEFIEFSFAPPERPRYHNYNNIGWFNPRTGCLEHLQYFNSRLCPPGIRPRNALQAMAFEAAYAPPERLAVVVFYGNAGSGKTYISLGSAVAQTNFPSKKISSERVYQGQNTKRRKKQHGNNAEMNEDAFGDSCGIQKPYNEIWCCPPDRMMGENLGAVPGDRFQKQKDKLDGYVHNLQVFLAAQHCRKTGGEEMNFRDIHAKAESYCSRINITSPGQINGDSFSNTVLLIDEAEFMKEAQIRTFIERIADGSKIFICGDPTQIRNPYGWYGNPLAKAVRRLAGDPQVAILRFDRDEDIQRPGARIANRCWGK